LQISLVISSLASGGAEKVMATMANYWATSNNSVTLITLSPRNTDFYQLHPQVKRVSLNLVDVSPDLCSAVSNNLRRVKRLREEIRRDTPDVVISFMDTTNVLTLLATVGSPTPAVVSERIDPRYHRINWIWAALRRLLYHRARAVVVQSEDVRGWAESVNHKNGVWVIPNPLNGAQCEAESKSDRSVSALPQGRLVVAMGRLVPQKGFDLLIQAFARCARKAHNWSLVILGDGEESGRLKTLAVELGIGARVSLAGRVAQPLAILRRAHLFTLSSRYEGFPNALLEAMACGLPVISFDCPSGPREIVRDGIDGVLVPPSNVAELAAAMERLMLDDEERRRLGLRAQEVTQRFGLERIMGIWNVLLDQITGTVTQ